MFLGRSWGVTIYIYTYIYNYIYISNYPILVSVKNKTYVFMFNVKSSISDVKTNMICWCLIVSFLGKINMCNGVIYILYIHLLF
jgi:hypothetical protein